MKNIKASKPILDYGGKKIVVNFKQFKDDMVLFLPEEICKDMELMENDPVDVTVENGSLIIKKLVRE